MLRFVSVQAYLFWRTTKDTKKVISKVLRLFLVFSFVYFASFVVKQELLRFFFIALLCYNLQGRSNHIARQAASEQIIPADEANVVGQSYEVLGLLTTDPRNPGDCI